MIKKWIKDDNYGLYSKIEYALKGDEVTIIGRSSSMVKVLNLRNQQIFFINENLLSDVQIPRNPVQPMSSGTQLRKGKKR